MAPGRSAMATGNRLSSDSTQATCADPTPEHLETNAARAIDCGRRPPQRPAGA